MEPTNLIIFFLATTGLTFIFNKSKLFSSFRDWVKARYTDCLNKQNKSIACKFWWWLNSIFECYMCMSVYTGIIVMGLIWLSLYFEWVIWVTYPFAGVPVVSLIIQHWDGVKRKYGI